MLKNLTKTITVAITITASIIFASGSALAAPTGILKTPQEQYEFSPRHCLVHLEDGVYDIEIDGPGITNEGEKFFIEFSSTANAISIGLGVDQRYQTSGRRIKAGQFTSEPFKINVTNDVIKVENIIFRGISDEVIDGSGSLLINCKQ